MNPDSTIVTDVVCPLCGSLCDDITVRIENGKIVEVRDACDMGESKILGHDRIKSPMIREKGELKEVSYEKAVKKSAEILAKSKRPLLYGWSSTTCEAHEKGIKLAAEVGGIVDNTATVCHGPSVIAIQTVGLPSCTLGQIKNRADLIVYWGSNQSQAHPRHMSRYSSFIRGFFREEGRKAKYVVVIDVRDTTTTNVADEFIKVEPGHDYKLLSALRAVLADKADVLPDDVGGVPKDAIMNLAERMKKAEFGVIFFGMGLTQSRSRYNNVVNAIALTRELNQFTKFVIMPMRGHYNVTGFGQVLTWETGYPYAVDLSRGYAWYNPGETTSTDVLNRGECDSALIIASDPGAHFPGKSLKHLSKIPVIQVDPYHNPTTEFADVVIPSAVAGIEAEGCAYRMDNVPIMVRKLIDSEYKSDEEIIDDVLNKVMEIRGGK